MSGPSQLAGPATGGSRPVYDALDCIALGSDTEPSVCRDLSAGRHGSAAVRVPIAFKSATAYEPGIDAVRCARDHAGMAKIATNRYVERAELEDFVRPRHRGVLITTKRNGNLQTSLVTIGLDTEGRVVVATYPERAKVPNLKRNSKATMVVMSDAFNDEWVQLDCTAEVIDLPDSVEPLVEYFRCISGEHSDWDEYREAMVAQGKSLIRLTIDDWGPIARGGFPPRLATDD